MKTKTIIILLCTASLLAFSALGCKRVQPTPTATPEGTPTPTSMGREYLGSPEEHATATEGAEQFYLQLTAMSEEGKE